jgi:hypothetical protein
MFHRLSVFALGVSLTPVLFAGEPQPRLPRDNLLVRRGADGKPAAVNG